MSRDRSAVHDRRCRARQAGTLSRPWTILIVDDDPEVHAATRLALLDTRFQDRPLAFVSAYSAAEARAELQTLRDVAIILLDVVMETDDARTRSGPLHP